MSAAPTQSLVLLAKKINSLNTGVVEQMVQSGKLLLEARTRLLQEQGKKRGGFQDWVKANLKITPQTATRYMRLAKSRSPLKVYASQAAARKKPAHPKNVNSPNWGVMNPINRAKAAFNALEPAARQEFLKWIAEQFDEAENSAVTKAPIRARPLLAGVTAAPG